MNFRTVASICLFRILIFAKKISKSLMTMMLQSSNPRNWYLKVNKLKTNQNPAPWRKLILKIGLIKKCRFWVKVAKFRRRTRLWRSNLTDRLQMWRHLTRNRNRKILVQRLLIKMKWMIMMAPTAPMETSAPRTSWNRRTIWISTLLIWLMRRIWRGSASSGCPPTQNRYKKKSMSKWQRV